MVGFKPTNPLGTAAIRCRVTHLVSLSFQQLFDGDGLDADLPGLHPELVVLGDQRLVALCAVEVCGVVVREAPLYGELHCLGCFLGGLDPEDDHVVEDPGRVSRHGACSRGRDVAEQGGLLPDDVADLVVREVQGVVALEVPQGVSLLGEEYEGDRA